MKIWVQLGVGTFLMRPDMISCYTATN